MVRACGCCYRRRCRHPPCNPSTHNLIVVSYITRPNLILLSYNSSSLSPHSTKILNVINTTAHSSSPSLHHPSISILRQIPPTRNHHSVNVSAYTFYPLDLRHYQVLSLRLAHMENPMLATMGLHMTCLQIGSEMLSFMHRSR